MIYIYNFIKVKPLSTWFSKVVLTLKVLGENIFNLRIDEKFLGHKKHKPQKKNLYIYIEFHQSLKSLFFWRQH